MYCILNMGWTPSQYNNLLPREKALVRASILLKIEQEKKHKKELEMKQAQNRAKIRRR